MSEPDVFDEVAAVADAVLYEGYLLYPYRASAQKNRVRWQWGVLMAGSYGSDAGETGVQRVEALVEPRGAGASVRLRVRFLHLERRTLTDAGGRLVDTLDVGDVRHLAFDEGVAEQVDATLPVAGLLPGATVPISCPAARTVEDLTHPDGSPAGRLVRTREALRATAALSAAALPGPYDVLRLHLEIRNSSAVPPGATRDEALRTALIGTHTLLAVAPGSFVSPTDPPEWAAPAVRGCVTEHCWPALAGPPDRDDLLLCAPIILGDHARLAPESTIDLFDGTENDEILTLRTMVLTDQEKAEARATDPRAAAIVDAVDHLPPEILERLHGAVRSLRPAGSAAPRVPDVVPEPGTPWWDPGADASVDPETDSVDVGGTPVARGSVVVLRPGRGADAQDAFLTGMRATVRAVVHDVDGGVHVAVSVDDDPAADLQLAHGRFRYFRPDELEPVQVTRVLVAGIGNVFLGDDGFGVEVAQRLLARGGLPDGVTVVDVGIRGVDLAYRMLDGWDGVLLVDALHRDGPPGTLYRLEHTYDGPPRRSGIQVDGHDMGPDVVLGLLRELADATGVDDPVRRVLVLGCEPADVEDGMGLSPAVAAVVDPACDAVTELVDLLLDTREGAHP